MARKNGRVECPRCEGERKVAILDPAYLRDLSIAGGGEGPDCEGHIIGREKCPVCKGEGDLSPEEYKIYLFEELEKREEISLICLLDSIETAGKTLKRIIESRAAKKKLMEP